MLLLIGLAGCSGLTKSPESFDRYRQQLLTDAEREQVIQDIQIVLGSKYTWGGDTVKKGFDCSGLIQWAFRQQGFGQFRSGDEVHHEITAHDMYHYNTEHVAKIDGLRHGDFIFFDEDGNGQITHNAAFDHVDDYGRVWVYDAYSIWGIAVYRYIENFWDKGPLFGRPMKTIPR